MMDVQLVRALFVSGGLILVLILVALASSRLERAAGASPRGAPAAVLPVR